LEYTLKYIKFKEQLATKTIAVIGVCLSIFTIGFTIYNLLYISHLYALKYKSYIGELSQKVEIYLLNNISFILIIIVFILSTASLIMGLISVLRSQKIGWLVMIVGVICFILNSL
jgi:hypothetical protein